MSATEPLYSTPYCELISPSGSITRRVRRCVISSGRGLPSTTCEVILDNRNLDFNGLFSKDDAMKVYLGYWDIGKWLSFTGTVMDVKTEADVTIYAKDDMRRAHETRIVQSFRDANPNDIVTFCVQKAGFSDIDIGGEQFPKRKHFILRNSNVTQAITLVERSWGIVGWSHYIDLDGRFVWKKWEQGDEISVFETGANILDIQPYGEMWRLHTFLFPWVRHSDVVRVRDKRLGYGIDEELFRVERMTYNYGVNNSMYMWLRKLSAIEGSEKIDVWGTFQADC